MTAVALVRSEATKLLTARSTWILALVSILGTWPMAWLNATSGSDIPPDDPRLFSAAPVPLEYQGFDMAGFGYVFVVALAALWAGSEYGAGNQIRTTLLATPQRFRLFVVKSLLLAIAVAAIAFLTMTGTVIVTHITGATGVNPWMLTPAIWMNIGGLTLAWTLSSAVTFAIGTLARSAILPLLLVIPLIVGVGDLLVTLWDGAKYLPIAAGTALYNDPRLGSHLDPLAGGLVQAGWALALLTSAGASFVRRDV